MQIKRKEFEDIEENNEVFLPLDTKERKIAQGRVNRGYKTQLDELIEATKPEGGYKGKYKEYLQIKEEETSRIKNK